MAEKPKTRELVIYTIVFAGVVLCALACGCTAASENTSSGNEPYATAAPDAMAPPEPGNGTMQAPPGNGTMQGRPGGEDRGMQNLATAAATLDVTEDELREALGTQEEGSGFDLEEAAAKLGVTVEELQNALGTPPEGAPGTPPDGQAPPVS